MKKICKFCAEFGAVSRRVCVVYYTDKKYYCRAFEKFVEKQSGCESWQPRLTEFDFSKSRFDKAEEDLKFIGKYLFDT